MIRYMSLQEVDTDFRGEHTAPQKDGANSLDNLEDIYPDDIYSSDGVRYYGDGTPLDRLSISIIQSMRGKPNDKVVVYRAIPKILTVQDQIAEYEKHKAYIQKRGKLPPGVRNWSDRSEYYDFISGEIERLEQIKGADQKEKIKINPGDWVTINRQYAVEHGKSALNNQYRILKKTVKAKDVFTDGNSVHEWGV